MSTTKKWLGVFLMIVMSGCASKRCVCKTDPPTPFVDVQSRTQMSYKASNGPEFNILVLSSGGQNGAFGAGILNSWQTNASFPRVAKFDIVAGSSIGALMSTYAYLSGCSNTSATPERLRDFFLRSTRRDWYLKRNILSILTKPTSLYSTRPLREHIESLISREVYDEVVNEVTKHPERRLFVSTVNADQGVLQIWDLTEIAAQHHPEGYKKYIDVLLAVAAVPVYFPAVFSDGEKFSLRSDLGKDYSMLLDGGLRDPVFLPSVVVPALMAQNPVEPGTPARKVRAFVVVNGYLGASSRCVNNNVVDIAVRSIDLMRTEILEDELQLIECRIREKEGEFKFTYVPDDIHSNGDALSFTLGDMEHLYQGGLNAQWHDSTPASMHIVPSPKNKR